MDAMSDQLQPRKGSVPAVLRAVRLLDLVAAAKEPMSFAAITAQLDLPKSTLHGLCTTLVDCGLLARFENGTYHLGIHVVDLAHAFLARTNLTTEFSRILADTQPLPEEAIVLSILDGADIVYVACRNGMRPFGFNFRIGMRLPANCAASGKALLSTLPTEQLADLARGGALLGLTNRSVTELEPLRKQLAQVCKRGYAVDNEETRLGMVCFGAPVFKAGTQEAAAAVGISLPKAALDPRLRAAAIQVVTDVASELSKRMGGS